MILPTALVDRWPAEEYKQQHQTIESALKHSVADTMQLYHDIKMLKEVENTYEGPSYSLTKEQRYDLKRNSDSLLHNRFVTELIQKIEKFDRGIKYSDYPAMIMAAYPESKFMDKSRFRDEHASITGPVLCRGIASGKIVDQVKAAGEDYYFIETGYLGNYRCENNKTGRKIYHRIVKNAMQHNTIMDVPSDRWDQLVDFNPDLKYNGWKRTGSKVLVVLSSDKPFQYYGHNREAWLRKVVRTLRKHTDREIVFREKATRGERTNDTIYDALDQDIYAVVTYNSIAAVEAIQYGIPAFCTAPTAASAVTTADFSQIENPPKPGEDVIYKWLSSVAYGQFSLHEILTGHAWQLVQDNELRPTFSY
jgi:hypothetical protein